MADQAERVILEAEDVVTPVVAAANASLEGFEKKATTAHEKVVRITDQTRTSVQRLVASLEKQADTFGKSGVDKLVAQRDQLLQRYAKEPQAIDAITRSYEKMIAVEEKAARAANAAKAAKEAEEAVQRQSNAMRAMGNDVTAFIQNPMQGAQGAISRVTAALGPFGIGVAAGVAALGAIAVAGFEAAKSLGEYAIQIRDVGLRTGLSVTQVSQFSYAAKLAGSDVSVFERAMRGLSQAMNEDSDEGAKARTELEKLHVTMYDAATGAVKPTAQAFTEIGAAIAALPTALERDAAAMALFKRAGIEAIPVMVQLKQNLEEARRQDFPGDDEIKRMEEYHHKVVQIEERWDRLIRKGKEALLDAGSWFNRMIDKVGGGADRFKGMQILPGDTDDDMMPPPPSMTGAQKSRVEAALAASGESRELHAAMAALEKTQKELTALRGQGAPWSKIGPVTEQVEREKGSVESIQQSIDKAKELKEAVKQFQTSSAEFEKKGTEADLDAVGKIFYQRDQLIAQAQKLKGVEADIVAIRKSADEQAGKIRTAEAAKFDLDWRKFEEAAQEDQSKRSLKMMERLGPSKDQMKEWEEWFRAQDQVDSINLEAQKDAITRKAGRAEKMVGLSGDTGMDAIRETYRIRIDLAKELAGVESERILKETDAAAKLIDGAKMAKDLNKEIAEAQEEAAMKQLELQKQQIDGLKKESEGLWKTLLTHPAKFPKELGNTIHEAVIKPVAEGMASMTANILHPAIFGADGGGGLAGIFKGVFGGSKPADPVKISTDQNTTATILNTAHVAALTAVLAGAMGMTAPAVAAPAGIAGLAGVSVPSISVPARMATTGMTGGAVLAEAMGKMAPAVAAPVKIAGLAGAFVPSISVPARMAAVGIPGGASFSAAPAPSYSDLASLPMNQDRIAQTLGMGGDGMSGSMSGTGGGRGGGAQAAPYSMSALANLPLNRQSPLSQMMGLAVGAGGKPGGLAGGLSGLESSVWNTKAFHGLPIDQTTAAGQLASGGLAVATSPAATAAGMMLATSGLMGKQMGSWGGIGMGTAGGGLLGAGIGMQLGGPMGAVLGAGIGAVAGFGIGLGEKLAGIESPTVKAQKDIKQIYGVNLPQNSGTIKQVVSIAQSEFGGDIAVAVRSPKVRQLVMLYSEATGQKMPLSAATPYAGSLAEQGGNLYQQASFQNNAFHSYASNLPTLGGNGGATFPTTPGPNTTSGGGGTYLSLNINGQPITADFVADQSLAAQNASYGRTQQSANLQVPGLMVA